MAIAMDQASDMSHPSLYAAIKLARLVQKVKNCLKSRIKKYIVHAKPQGSTPYNILDMDTRRRVRRYVEITWNAPTCAKS